MLQALWAERFHLVVRQQMRETPAYELGVGKDGSKLKQGTEAAGWEPDSGPVGPDTSTPLGCTRPG
jgi:uncharacterized protein (TIGR03435 family)